MPKVAFSEGITFFARDGKMKKMPKALGRG